MVRHRHDGEEEQGQGRPGTGTTPRARWQRGQYAPSYPSPCHHPAGKARRITSGPLVGYRGETQPG